PLGRVLPSGACDCRAVSIFRKAAEAFSEVAAKATNATIAGRRSGTSSKHLETVGQDICADGGPLRVGRRRHELGVGFPRDTPADLFVDDDLSASYRLRHTDVPVPD